MKKFSQQKTGVFHIFAFLCLCLVLFTSCESHRIIVNNLDEREANEIIVFLSTKKIEASKTASVAAGGGGGSKIPMYDISVNSDVALEAMSYLNQAGLPRRRSMNLLNLFTGAGLVPSEMEQEIRYQAGLAEQIASTVRKMDGVLDAEVQLSVPKEDPLNPTEKKQPITASVYVKHNGVLDDPNSHLQTRIKRLVSAGVAGLSYDNVTVVGEKARSNDYLTGLTSPSLEEEKQYVSIWTLIIAKESVTRFRIIFFTFTLFLLFLLSLLVWMTWKIYPTIKAQGGFREFFKIKHAQSETKPEADAKALAEKEAAAKEAAKKLEEQGSANKDVDET